MIVFDHVSFSYAKGYVLNDVCFKIAENEKVAIMGGSGEGKTTILKLIIGLIRPDSGRIIIDGEDITVKSEDEMRDVRLKFSIVFQEGALFDSLNVRENVAFCLREYSGLTEDEIFKRVKDLLATVGVEHAIELMPEELSGGMHRRVAIARSLAAFKPEMLLYDEPTSGLDPVNAANICKLIVDLSKDGKGFVIVTHKVYDAINVADRFMFLRNGGIIFDGDKGQLLHTEIPDIQAFTSELRLMSH